ncbi:SpoIIE family protein phosphatase [Streptomyces sp. NA02950]|uniref:ATP-binding SpoIIE family protein phosphatase n=1 Tax=Streptomyces sp. NA02950 TaxID=2742137 RepID=UPI00159180F6|nr:SpoIIE family protein phosphatase [Streptomyces sp. NA02950]QKV96448.1 SpoIIE family protein phosphatase [Streptomyces sp. NA02950]
MDTTTDSAGDRGFCLDRVASVVLDGAGTVTHWSAAATDLLGLSASDVVGRPVTELLVEDQEPPGGPGLPPGGRARLRHATQGSVDTVFRTTPLDGGGCVVLAAPADTAAEWGQGVALLRALFAQDGVGVAVHDADLKVLSVNAPSGRLPGADAVRSRLAEVVDGPDAPSFRAVLREVMETGNAVIDREQSLSTPDGDRAVGQCAFRLDDARGVPTGVMSLFRDTTEQKRVRDHLELLRDSASRISASLDAVRVAEDLVDVLVPGLGDLATVELHESVLAGDEPPRMFGGGKQHLVRVAGATTTGDWPDGLLTTGTSYPPLPDNTGLRAVQGGAAITTDRVGAVRAVGPEQERLFIPDGGHALAVAPLRARGLVLGLVAVWRTDRPEAFDEDERVLLTEICSRAALGIDNARRFAREHRAAVALQERLLPHAVTDTLAAETAGSYRPASGGAGISGDWFDVIPLPCLRVAFVVGDVIGHGLPATAAMGRLRTAIQTLAALELDPDDLLSRVEDLVEQLAAEATQEQRDAVGATCLIGVYDPVDRQCTLASAGHPPPAVVAPDGTTRFVDLAPGPPLGVGGMPFEPLTIELAPGSVLALYTDGLISRDRADLETGMDRLRDELAAQCRPHRPLNEISAALLDGVDDERQTDDSALLLARTRTSPLWTVASWEFPADPASVARARKATADQLATWGLEELAFSTELIVSELVTNAIRYAGGPIGVRLIRENGLICEVTDPSSTQPRLRRAGDTDEGGRGLFLVAQMTTRWGSRYSRRGKTIWTEQTAAPPGLG